MKTHSCDQTRVGGGSKLGKMQKGSHTISKEKPKIRIIHIVAPEIIKTDVENFRALVQRLTGKPLGKDSSGNMKKNSSSMQTIKQGKKKKTDANANANAFLSFLGDGFMHGNGMNNNNNIHDFPLLQFRSNSQINTFGLNF